MRPSGASSAPRVLLFSQTIQPTPNTRKADGLVKYISVESEPPVRGDAGAEEAHGTTPPHHTVRRPHRTAAAASPHLAVAARTDISNAAARQVSVIDDVAEIEALVAAAQRLTAGGARMVLLWGGGLWVAPAVAPSRLFPAAPTVVAR